MHCQLFVQSANAFSSFAVRINPAQSEHYDDDGQYNANGLHSIDHCRNENGEVRRCQSDRF